MENDERIADLERKIAARENEPGFAANVAEMKAEVERLKNDQS